MVIGKEKTRGKKLNRGNKSTRGNNKYRGKLSDRVNPITPMQLSVISPSRNS
jgi:hypothetical protein